MADTEWEAMVKQLAATAPTGLDVLSGIAFAERILSEMRDGEFSDLDGTAVEMSMADCSWPYGREEEKLAWLLASTIKHLADQDNELFFVKYDLLGRTHLAGPWPWNEAQPHGVELMNLDGVTNVTFVEASEVLSG